MRKIKLLFPVITALLLGSILWSCSKDQETPTETQTESEFSFGISTTKSGSLLKSVSENTLADAKSIVLTIQNSDGTATKYTSTSVQIFEMNGTYYTQKLALKVGNYKLTEFFLLDISGNTIFAAPLAGSLQAQNVSNPLPILFEIEKNKVSSIGVEVLSTKGHSPEDYGLSVFPIISVNTFSFMIVVADHQQDSILSATLNVSNGTYCFTQNLDAIANNVVTIKDGISNYTLLVTKSGYEPYSYTFTLDSLKTYESKVGNLPLVIELTRATTSDLVAYYPFNGNANDESGHSNNGTVNGGASLVTDRNGNANSAYFFDRYQSVTVTGFGDVVPTNDITISLWANAPHSNANFAILLGTTVEPSRLGISINYQHDSQNTIFWDYGWNGQGGDAPGRLYNRPAAVDSTWHHYVFISSIEQQTMKIYKDNSLISEKSQPLALTDNAGKTLNIGSIFYGSLDEIRIYNRVLNTDEIESLYNE